MKLEVGQKIGIYEALSDIELFYNYLLLIKGKCYLGLDLNFSVELMDEDENPNNTIEVAKSEVRKVGSLTVKKLK